MIQKVKQWTYINQIFITPITKLKEEIINLLQSNKEGYGQKYIETVNKAEAIANNLQELLYKKIKNQFPLTYKNCLYNNLQEFLFNNPIELFRVKHLKINCNKANSKDEKDLIGFFNYIIEDGELYSQIYFILCEIK